MSDMVSSTDSVCCTFTLAHTHMTRVSLHALPITVSLKLTRNALNVDINHCEFEVVAYYMQDISSPLPCLCFWNKQGLLAKGLICQPVL